MSFESTVLVGYLVGAAVGVLAFYWVVRLAVTHGIRAARRDDVPPGP